MTTLKQRINISTALARTAFKALFFPGVPGSLYPEKNLALHYPQGIQNDAKNLSKWQNPYQLPLIKDDLGFWRSALTEAELPLQALPYRVRMQQVYQETMMNGHVRSCVEKRLRLTLSKEFYIDDVNGGIDTEATKIIQVAWFKKLMRHALLKQPFGYTLISLGDMMPSTGIDKGPSFPNLNSIRRWNISPDREILSFQPYVPTGIPFTDPMAEDDKGNKYVDWNIYLTTPNDKGVSKCGYGYFYEVALYEIINRSLIAWNTDFLELFGQPLRVGRTNKKDEEREQFEEIMKKVGASGWAVMDPKGEGDDIEFVEAAAGRGAGSGWMGYGDMFKRNNQEISKLILGHPMTMDSMQGKIGSQQGKQTNVGIGTSPEQIALDEIESFDSKELLYDINNVILPTLRNLGFNIKGKCCVKDDLEQLQIRMNENKNYLDEANIQMSIAKAGGIPDWKFFNNRTGMNIKKAPVPVNPTANPIPGTNTGKSTGQIEGEPNKPK